MNSSKMFSILFNSFWLFIHYILNLKEKRTDTGALSLLIKTFMVGPRAWDIESVQHYDGFCYVALLSDKSVSDLQGRSTLILLENNRNLPFPNTRDLNEIVKKGGGRYLHVDDKLFFSPLDNAGNKQVASRKYTLLETLVDDQERIEQLLALNNDIYLKNNPTLQTIEKLMIYLKDRFSFDGLSDFGKNSYDLHKIRLDLRQWHLSICAIQKIEVRYGILFDDSLITLNLKNCEIEGVNGIFDATLKFVIDNHFQIRPVGISCHKNDILLINADLNWENKVFKEAAINTDSVRSFIEELMISVGGNPADYQRWIESMIRSITSADMGFNWTMDEESQRGLIESLSPGTKETSFELKVTREDDSMHIRFHDKTVSESNQ